MASKGSVNKVIILGNLGADPELRNLPDGSSMVNFNVATTESYPDKNNPQNRIEKTEWHRVSFFGRQAETIHEYCRKGSKIYVEGSIHTRKWQDPDGNDRYITDIRGRDFTFVGARGGGEGSGGAAGGGGGSSGSKPADDNFGDMDDVPF